MLPPQNPFHPHEVSQLESLSELTQQIVQVLVARRAHGCPQQSASSSTTQAAAEEAVFTLETDRGTVLLGADGVTPFEAPSPTTDPYPIGCAPKRDRAQLEPDDDADIAPWKRSR